MKRKDENNRRHDDEEEQVFKSFLVTVQRDELVRATNTDGDTTTTTATTGMHVRGIMKLTNLDFLYVFDTPIASGQVVTKMKDSLEHLLGHYPTLAGRIDASGTCIAMNNQGVAFRVQQAQTCDDSSSVSIHDIPPEPATGAPYCTIPVPEEQVMGQAPLLTLTITHFSDGWTLGVVMNHIVADAWTFAMFMKDWSDVLKTTTIGNCCKTIPPSTIFPTRSMKPLPHKVRWIRQPVISWGPYNHRG